MAELRPPHHLLRHRRHHRNHAMTTNPLNIVIAAAVAVVVALNRLENLVMENHPRHRNQRFVELTEVFVF